MAGLSPISPGGLGKLFPDDWPGYKEGRWCISPKLKERLFDAVTFWWCDSVMVWMCDRLKVWWCDDVVVRPLGDLMMWFCDGVMLWLYDGVIMWLYVWWCDGVMLWLSDAVVVALIVIVSTTITQLKRFLANSNKKISIWKRQLFSIVEYLRNRRKDKWSWSIILPRIEKRNVLRNLWNQFKTEEWDLMLWLNLWLYKLVWIELASIYFQGFSMEDGDSLNCVRF